MGTENLDRSAVGVIEVDSGSGWQNLGIIRQETVRVNGEEIKHLDVSSYPFGTDLAIFGNLDIEIEFVWEEVADVNLWNIILHGGSMVTTNEGTQNVVNEAVALNGASWKPLAYAGDFKSDCAVTVSSEVGGGGVVYSEGVDYYLDRRSGHLARVVSGSITDGQTVYVDYTYKTYSGKHFEIYRGSKPTNYTLRLTKPLLNSDNMRITHSKVSFSTSMEMPLNPGEEGAWTGVTTKIKFLKDKAGIYGEYGRWEIFTPQS